MVRGYNNDDGAQKGSITLDKMPQYANENLTLAPIGPGAPLCVEYAAVSLPGAEPGRPIKTNQDSALVCELVQQNAALMAVFDGHGSNGHKASRYVKERFGKHWQQLMEAEAEMDSVKRGECGAQLRNAAKRANWELLRQKFDLSTSGSTGVVVCMLGDHLTCANVGDSRAVLGTRKKGKTEIETTALSNDHKPDLPEEHLRIQMSGGRVCPIEMNGEYVGAPRIWMADEDAPGLCMSRSYGDELGASVGVICDPELISATVSDDPDTETVLVIGSDGIFEFIENEEVMRLAYEMLDQESSSTATKVARTSADLIALARQKWQEEEGEVIDDCTCIVARITRSAPPADTAAAPAEA